MENQNFVAPLAGVAGLLVARWLLDRFAVMNKLLRVAVLIVVPIVTAASLVVGPRLIESYVGRHSSTYGRMLFEESVFKQYPAFRAIADNEPELWKQVRKEVVAIYQAHGNQISSEAATQIAATFKPLNDKLKKVGMTADDDHIVRWVAAEHVLVSHLMQENVRQCAGYLLGVSLDQTEPSPLTVSLQRNVQSAMMDSYIAGLKAPVVLPTEEAGVALLTQAIRLQANPFVDEEISVIQSPANRDVAQICRAWNKLYSNTLALRKGDAANLMRFLLSGS